MQAWLVLMRRSATRAGGLAGCGLLVACSSGGESFWKDHGAVMLRPSRHEIGVVYSFGGGESPRDESNSAAGLSVASRIAAAMVPTPAEDPLPGAGSFDFKGGRLYIHAPKKHQNALPLHHDPAGLKQ